MHKPEDLQKLFTKIKQLQIDTDKIAGVASECLQQLIKRTPLSQIEILNLILEWLSQMKEEEIKNFIVSIIDDRFVSAIINDQGHEWFDIETKKYVQTVTPSSVSTLISIE